MNKIRQDLIVLIFFIQFSNCRTDSLLDFIGKRNDLEVFDVLRMVQIQMSNRTAKACLPGFLPFAGACYFLSPVKSSWTTASAVCSSKRNASLVSFDTDEELNFVVEKLLKPWNVNQAFIGLYARETGQWSWLDGRTFWDSIFGPLFYVYRPETSRCGLINLVNRTQTAIEGRDCSTDEAHFLCKYVQDSCFGKNICGRGGECLSFGSTYRCQCNFFYRGRHCENLSSKAIQSLIALCLILLMAVWACCLKFDLFSSSRPTGEFFHQENHFQQRLVENP